MEETFRASPKMNRPPRQEYSASPTSLKDVNGCSSQIIYSFMTGAGPGDYSHPQDVDDWERNRALLLCFPEWKQRLPEMKCLSPAWNRLVEQWAAIEAMYDKENATFGRAIYGGSCCQLIQSLVKDQYERSYDAAK